MKFLFLCYEFVNFAEFNFPQLGLWPLFSLLTLLLILLLLLLLLLLLCRLLSSQTFPFNFVFEEIRELESRLQQTANVNVYHVTELKTCLDIK